MRTERGKRNQSGAIAQAWLRWLAPSGAVIVALLATWSWRGLMLVARGAEVNTAVQQRELVKGFVWDALLVHALFLLVRSGVRLAQSARPLGLALVTPAWLILALIPLARAVDLGHCYLARSHFTAESFVYLTGGFYEVLATGRAAGLAAAVVCAILLHIAMTKRDAEATAQLALPDGAAVVSALLVATLLVVRALWGAATNPPHEYALTLVPEANLVRQGAQYLHQGATTPQPLPPVSAAQWQKWQQWGWVPRDGRANAQYPLLRAASEEPPLDLPPRPGAPAHPNVVLTLMESTSSVFIHELSGQYRGLMPNVSALATQMTRVDGYHNVASPTIAGTVGTLCSVFSPLHPADLQGQHSPTGQPAFSCLSDVLKRQQYRTVFIGGHDPRQAGTDVFLQGHDFDEVHGDTDLLRRFPNSAKSTMGLHDDSVLRYAREQVERLERLRSEDGRPFLLVVATLDSHEPGLAAEDCQLPTDATGAIQVEGVPADAGGRKQLAAYHCADKAMGEFGRFLLEPARKSQLMWVVTADHAPFHTLANESVYQGRDVGWSFDKLPLLIHDPLHVLPPRVQVLSGTLDVAPTILHLLGLSDATTSMTGHSIWGRRPQLPMLIGRVGTRTAWVSDGVASHEVPFGALKGMCERAEPVVAGRPGLPDACEVHAYFQWLDALWTHRRLRPMQRIQPEPSPTH